MRISDWSSDVCSSDLNAASYSASDRVVEPLNYDIEPFDFFRVEGHIGKPITTALQTVTSQRDELNLPFEITALSTATVRAFFNSKDHECHFRDLEALYQVDRKSTRLNSSH